MGHTTQRDGKIAARCGGQLLVIDTGIASHYGGMVSALELRGSEARALYPSETVLLPSP